MPFAPNVLPIIRGVLADPRFFHIDPSAEVERGQITDEVVRRLGGRPWGRKDRDKNPETHNNSDDALCYLLPDGRFEIYDILIGLGKGSPRDLFAAFSYAGTFADGENGYFRDVPPRETPAPPPASPAPPIVPPLDLAPLHEAIAQLDAQVQILRGELAALGVRTSPVTITGMTGRAYGHAHAFTVVLDTDGS